MPAPKKNGSGIREVSPGKLRVTMYDPRAKGKTKHVGTFTFPPQPKTAGNWYPTRAKAVKAAEKAKAKQEELRDQQAKAPNGGRVESVESFASRWPRDYLTGKGGRPRGETTLAHNAERVRALIRDFGDRPLNGISPIEAETWIKGGIAPDEIKHIARRWHKANVLPDGDVLVPEHTGHHVVVRSMFNDAIKTWPDLGSNPFSSLNVPEKQGRRDDAITVLEPSELDLLVEAAVETLGSDYGRYYGALIECAAWTGMRPGELWAIDVDDNPAHNFVDHANAEIRDHWQWSGGKSKRPKMNSRRTIILLPPAAAAFRRAQGERTDGPMFHSIRGLRMRNHINQDYWEQVRALFWSKLPKQRQSKILDKDGGPEPGKIPLDLAFYELRHFFGTRLAEMGVPAKVIADQMGHKDGGELAMKRYVHASDKWIRQSMLDSYADYERRQRRAASGE